MMNSWSSFARIKQWLGQHPFALFFVAAITLLLFFSVRNFLAPATTNETGAVSTPKETGLFVVGKDMVQATAIGTIEREHAFTIVSTVSGTVSRLSTKEGTPISAGREILRITPNLGASNPAELNRELAEATRDSQRLTTPLERSSLSVTEDIERRGTESERRDRLARLKKDLGDESLDLKLRIAELNAEIARASEGAYAPHAPISGTLNALFVSPGMSVIPGTPLASIVGKNPKTILRTFVPASVALRIHPTGQHIAHLPDGSETRMTLTSVAQEAAPEDRFQILFLLDDMVASRTGETEVALSLELLGGEPMPLVPLSLVRISSDRASVLLEEDGRAVSRLVKLGAVIGSVVEVTEGLKASDRLVRERFVIDGDQIEILPSPETDQPSL